MQFNPRIVPCYSFLLDLIYDPFETGSVNFSIYLEIHSIKKLLQNSLSLPLPIARIKNSTSQHTISSCIFICTVEIKRPWKITLIIKRWKFEGNAITKVTHPATRKGWKEISSRHLEETIGFRGGWRGIGRPSQRGGVLFGCFSFGELSLRTRVQR